MTAERKRLLIQIAVVVALVLVAIIPTLIVSSKSKKTIASLEQQIQDMENKFKEDMENILAGLNKEEPGELKTEAGLIEAIKSGNANIGLAQDITLEEEVKVEGNLTIQLNGNKLIIGDECRILVTGTLTIKDGTVTSKSLFTEEGHDLGIVVKSGATLNVSGVKFLKEFDGSAVISNHTDGNVNITDCKFVGVSNANTLLFNNGTMVISNSSLSNSCEARPTWNAAIMNYAKLTLNNVTISSTGVCVSTFSDEAQEVSTTVNGGSFTRLYSHLYYAPNGVFYVVQFNAHKTTKLAFTGEVKVSCPAEGQPVCDQYNTATVEGANNIK